MSEAAALVPAPRHALEPLRELVLNSVRSPHSRRAYGKALDGFFSWYAEFPRAPFSKAVVAEYRTQLELAGLAASTINVRLAAIRKLAAEAADNGLLDPVLAAGIGKVRGATQHGTRAGNWLTKEQARQLLAAPDPHTMKGKRDRALLSLLLGCGLRRSELVALTVDDLAMREARWVLVDLMGKGSRLRTVPVPAWVKAQVDTWTAAASITAGKLLRAVDKAGRVWGDGLTEKVAWWTVTQYARPLGFGHLAPHDLRRTCAKLCRASGGELEQIQMLLGHSSVSTTERYLGTRQNLVRAVNDDLGIDVKE